MKTKAILSGVFSMTTKTHAARLIPFRGKTVGDHVSFGGLLGHTPIMAVNRWAETRLVRRGGRVQAPLGGPQELTSETVDSVYSRRSTP